MRIAFDVDGVVLNSIEIILDHINRSTGRSLTGDDLDNWELERLGIDADTLWNAVDYMYSLPYITPYNRAIETLSKIHRLTGRPLLFITGRRDPATALKQLEALDWTGEVPEMVVTGGDRRKTRYLAECEADFIIEDDTEHLLEYIDNGVGVGLMMRPWNRSSVLDGPHRFRGWREVENWFMASQEGLADALQVYP